jgi:hypothetical protein
VAYTITTTHKSINVSIIANDGKNVIDKVIYTGIYFGSFSALYILVPVTKLTRSSLRLDCKAVARIPEKHVESGAPDFSCLIFR